MNKMIIDDLFVNYSPEIFVNEIKSILKKIGMGEMYLVSRTGRLDDIFQTNKIIEWPSQHQKYWVSDVLNLDKFLLKLNFNSYITFTPNALPSLKSFLIELGESGNSKFDVFNWKDNEIPELILKNESIIIDNLAQYKCEKRLILQPEFKVIKTSMRKQRTIYFNGFFKNSTKKYRYDYIDKIIQILPYKRFQLLTKDNCQIKVVNKKIVSVRFIPDIEMLERINLCIFAISFNLDLDLAFKIERDNSTSMNFLYDLGNGKLYELKGIGVENNILNLFKEIFLMIEKESSNQSVKSKYVKLLESLEIIV
jgi:hypothetical protein